MEKLLFADPNICTGCRICEVLCSFIKTGEVNPTKSRIKIYRMEREGINVPIVCNQCEEAYCMAVCRPKALKRDVKTGGILLEDDLCIRCKACVIACPYGGVTFDSDGRVIKCDLCNGDPVCVKNCSLMAITYAKPERVLTPRLKAFSHKMVRSLMPME